MGSSDIVTVASPAEKAIKVLRAHILNPPTSIATAILPRRMADRLNLASHVFSLERFLEARQQNRPELLLISAALPAQYMEAEFWAEGETKSSELCPSSTEPEDIIKIALPRSKIDLARGIAELPPLRASSVQVTFSDGPDKLATDNTLPEEGLVLDYAAKIWAGIRSFGGFH